MKAEELRIGNLLTISIKNTNGINVEGITASGLMDLFCNGSKSSFEYKPIPLTEEWLIKLDKQNESLLVDKIGFVIFKNGYAYQFVRYDYKHVHQLQNLYFALTGEELQIKQ